MQHTQHNTHDPPLWAGEEARDAEDVDEVQSASNDFPQSWLPPAVEGVSSVHRRRHAQNNHLATPTH